MAAHWFTSMLPKATLVYKNHALLWLSAKKLFDAGEIASPEGVRALIEASYPESVELGPGERARALAQFVGPRAGKRRTSG